MKHTPMPWVDGDIEGITGPTTPSTCGPTVLEQIEFDGWFNNENRRNIPYPQRRHKVIAHGLTTIAIVTDADEGPDTMMANFYLMKAAPELLEALRGVRFVINADPTLYYLKNEPWWGKVQKAIAKALGNPTMGEGQQ